jgi:hypothetical protein
MAVTRMGFVGSSAAYVGFESKEGAAPDASTGSRFRYGYRYTWASLWLLTIGRWIHG